MQNVKILYITYNGVSESIFQSQCLPYLKGLSQRGYEITLLSYEKDTSGRAGHAGLLKDLGINWYKLKYHKKPRVIASSYDFLLGMWVSLFIVLRRRIAIIHVRATHGAIIGAPVARILRRKFIFDTRGLDSEEYADGNIIAKNSFLHKFLFKLEKYLFSQSASIVLLSHNAHTLLEEKGLTGYLSEDNTYVIPCATDLNLFKCNKKRTVNQDNGVKFIYVGSIGTWYMLDEMLDFFMIAKAKLRDSKLGIFTQSDRGVILKKMRRLRIEGSVELKYASYNSMPIHIAAADVGLCFIRPLSSKRASSPTKIGEYLACGLPVIVNSGIGDTDGIIRDNKVGVVVDGFAEPHYKRALLELAGLLDERDLPKRCRQTAERHFSLSDAVNTYDIMYRTVATGRNKLK